MKYQVKEEGLARLLHERPALISIVTELTESLIFKIFENDSWSFRSDDMYRNLPAHLKTLKVTKQYLETRKANLEEVSEDLRAQFTPTFRSKLIEKCSTNIYLLPNPTEAEWVYALTNKLYELERIPVETWTKAMVLTVFKGHYWRDSNRIKEALNKLISPEFALEVVRTNHLALELIPFELITKELVAEALSGDDSIEFSFKVPDEVWTPENVEAALDSRASNIALIPLKFLTSKHALLVAESVSFNDLPYMDYDILVAYTVGHAHSQYIDDASLKLYRRAVKKYVKNKVEFLSKVIIQSGILNFSKLGFDSSSVSLTEIVQANPYIIRHIPKQEQTDEIIDAFFSNATPENIDQMANYLNLGKIKMKHAPFLLNTDNRALEERRNKFLKGDQEKQEGLIEIDMAPSEYAKVRSYFK